jgi:hypothetical protein
LLTGDFANEQAERFARRLEREAPGNLQAQVQRAIRLTTAREPASDEIRADAAFIGKLMSNARLGSHAALAQYCLLTLNANEFVYLD